MPHTPRKGDACVILNVAPVELAASQRRWTHNCVTCLCIKVQQWCKCFLDQAICNSTYAKLKTAPSRGKIQCKMVMFKGVAVRGVLQDAHAKESCDFLLC